MRYDVDYYVHVNTKDDACTLLASTMPYRGHQLSTAQGVNVYAGPVVEQAGDQVVQVTPLEQGQRAEYHNITGIVHGASPRVADLLRDHA